jgi:hypothetical protein
VTSGPATRTAALAAIPVALIALLVGPAVIGGQIPWFMDIVAQFYPIRHFAAQTMHTGLLPLWNPTYDCGVPLLANPQWGVLYPINWLFFLWPSGPAFMLGYLLHQIILALGGFWLARALFVSPLAALAAVCVLAFGGWTWAHCPFGAYLAAVCWAPWVLGCLERHAREPRRRWIVLAGILWTLQILAGAPQATFLCSLAYGAMAAMLAIRHRKLAPIWFLLLALLLALGLSAAQWAPTADLMRQTVRGEGLKYEEVRQGTLHLWGEASLLNALVGGNVFIAAQGEDAESTAYVGYLGLILVIAGLLPRRARETDSGNEPIRGSAVRRYAVLLLLALLYSWSRLSDPLFHSFPGYARFHDPKRVLLVAHLALGVLVAGGVEWFTSRPRAPRWLTAIAALCVIALTVDLLVFAQLHIDHSTVSAADLGAAPAMNPLLARLQSGDPPSRVAGIDSGIEVSYDFRRPDWRWRMLPDQPTLFGLLDAQGFDPTIPARARIFFDTVNEGFISLYPRQFCLVRNWESPLVDLLALRWTVGAAPGTAPPEFAGHERAPSPAALSARYRSVEDLPLPPRSGLSVHENITAESRLVHRARFIAVPDVDQATAALRALGENVHDVTVLELPGARRGEYRAPPGSAESFTIHHLTETPNQLTAELEAPPGWIVLRDQVLPGWHADVDGREAPIIPADVLFRAVEWPGGRHILRFAYRPAAFALGLFLSLATVAVLIACIARRV